MIRLQNIIPPNIWTYWQNKYGPYLAVTRTESMVIFYENGTLGSFHPSGDRLARHCLVTGITYYIWNNDYTSLLTEAEYMAKLELSNPNLSTKE